MTTSLKGNEDYFSFPPVWIPPEPSLVHYQSLFTRGNGWLYFKNSLAISTLSMFVALLFSVPTAYSIARFRFGGSLFSNFLLLLRTMPAIALVLPIYVLYSKLGLTNHYFGLILLYTVFYIPFAVWLLIGFIRDVPSRDRRSSAHRRLFALPGPAAGDIAHYCAWPGGGGAVCLHYHLE